MPSLNDHIQQSNKNLNFLEQVDPIPDIYDWKITICYYVAVHLINGFVSDKINYTFRKHVDILDAINPNGRFTASRLPESVFESFRLLSILSRRSRYLTDVNNASNNTVMCKEKHFAKAIMYVEEIMRYIDGIYKPAFTKPSITCNQLKGVSLVYFTII